MFIKYYINFLIGLWDDWKTAQDLSVQVVDDEKVFAFGVELKDKNGWQVANVQAPFVDEDGTGWSYYFEVINIGDVWTYGYVFSYDIGERMWEVEYVKFKNIRGHDTSPSISRTYMVDDCCVASWLKGLAYGYNQLPYGSLDEFPTENH